MAQKRLRRRPTEGSDSGWAACGIEAGTAIPKRENRRGGIPVPPRATSASCRKGVNAGCHTNHPMLFTNAKIYTH